MSRKKKSRFDIEFFGAEVEQKREDGDTDILMETSAVSIASAEFLRLAPGVQTPSDIAVDKLQNPFFIELPIAKVDAQSRNRGRKFLASAVESIQRQVNTRRPEGYRGHIPDEDLSTSYPEVALRWIAAEMDANGVLWGKALVMDNDAIKYYSDSDALNAEVGTSIRGVFHMRPSKDGDFAEVFQVDLFSIDQAPPALVGVPETAARARISREQSGDGSNDDEEDANAIDASGEIRDTMSDKEQDMKREEKMPEEKGKINVDGGTVAYMELEKQRTEAQKQVDDLSAEMVRQKPFVEAGQNIIDLTQKPTVSAAMSVVRAALAEMDEIRKALDVSGNDSVAEAVRGLVGEMAEVHKMRSDLVAEMVNMEIDANVKTKSGREMVAKLVETKNVTNRESAQSAVKAVLAQEFVSDMLKAELSSEMGGSVKNTDSNTKDGKEPAKKFVIFPDKDGEDK